MEPVDRRAGGRPDPTGDRAPRESVMPDRERRWDAGPSAEPARGHPGEMFPRVEANPRLWETFTAWEVPDPEGGQLWRLRWNDAVVLAAVEPRSDARTFSALPVSEDPQFATDSDLILDPDESSLGMAAMVQVALEMVLHRRVLDRCLGRLADSAWKDLLQLRSAFVRSEPSGLPLGRVGPPVTHELDERLQYRAEQREVCMALAFAEWYAPPSGPTTAGLIRSRLEERRISLADLAARSGIPVQTVMRLLREEGVDLSRDQLERLAGALDLDAEELGAALAERFPERLVEAIDSPGHKARVYAFCERWGSGEPETRRRLARELVGLARRAKQMTVSDWSRLLEEHFSL